MCSYSVIAGYGLNRIPRDQWTRDMKTLFQQLLEKAKEFDTVAKQPDCNDAHKTKEIAALLASGMTNE